MTGVSCKNTGLDGEDGRGFSLNLFYVSLLETYEYNPIKARAKSSSKFSLKNRLHGLRVCVVSSQLLMPPGGSAEVRPRV